MINDVSQATSAQICSNVIAKLVYTNDEQVWWFREKNDFKNLECLETSIDWKTNTSCMSRWIKK